MNLYCIIEKAYYCSEDGFREIMPEIRKSGFSLGYRNEQYGVLGSISTKSLPNAIGISI